MWQDRTGQNRAVNRPIIAKGEFSRIYLNLLEFAVFEKRLTDGPTDGLTDGLTDRPTD